MQINNLFVVVMGIGIVFIVLTLIIVLCALLGKACNLGGKKEAAAEVVPAPVETAIANPAELAAAVAVAIAEYSNTDAAALCILSIKKV